MRVRCRAVGRRLVLGILVTAIALCLAPQGIRAQAPQFTVNHPPRLQLGDAPLAGFPGSAQDRVQILWQTLPVDSSSLDTFETVYRSAGSGPWTDAGVPDTLHTGFGGRVNHYVDITDLDYDTDYEYRVRHMFGSIVVEDWRGMFRTRLQAGDMGPFSFAAYGDSAHAPAIRGFRDVQNRINLIDPAFTLLLGDNCYYVGSHGEMDARFDDDDNPEAHRWTSEHVDYVGFGNHDVATSSGRPSEDNFAVPLPVAGRSAPAEPPADERDEHNYGFDYGMAHFMTFDTNSLNDARRLDGQLKYIEAEMADASARWKIVFGHHPVGGAPDKYEGPGDLYFQQVVPRLRAAGVDLLLVGHSHTFSWSYPMIDARNGEVVFVRDTDKDYTKGDGLVQVVSGLGGKSLRSGSFTSFPFVARGFSTSTSPPAEFGMALVHVNQSQLTVRYVAADDGAVIDQFTISDGLPRPVVTVEALRHRIKEGRPAKGAFRITRDDTHGELTVHFRVGGSATEGADYDPIGSSLTLAEGMASAELKFATIDDGDLEGAETVRLTIEPHQDYATRAPFSDTVILLDDDVSPTPMPTSAHPPPTPATTPTPSTATMRLDAEHGP